MTTTTDWQAEAMRKLRAERNAAQVELERAREVLRDIQFASQPDGGTPFCPVCWRTRGDGHAPDCALSATLAAKGE